MATMPQNPFSGLFGGGTGQTTTTQPKQRTNPFEGLFETQPVKPERQLDQYGLPQATISAAPAKKVEPEQPDTFFTKVAKIVLPKKLEEYFGLTKPAEPTIKERVVKGFEEGYAYEDLKKLEQQVAEGGGKLPKQTAGGVLKETKGEKYVPFLSAVPDIVSSVQLYQSAKRVESGEETFVDIYRLAKFKAESERDRTFGAKVTSVLTELPSFGGELLLTGGIYSAGKKATESAIMETLQKAVGKTAGRIIGKSAANIVGGTLQTLPARGLEITAGTIQNMIPDYRFETNELGKLQPVISGEGDDLWKAAAKSLSNQWVEVVSEHSGGIFEEAAAPLKNQLMKIGILKSFLKANPAAKTSDFMKLVNRAGWNGVIGEMGEERIGELARGLLTQVGLSEDGWKLPTPEQLAVELVSFSIPGVMIGAVNKGAETAGGFEPPEEEKPIPTETKPITEADMVIGARDILSVTRGATDTDPNAVRVLQDVTREYQSQMAEKVLTVQTPEQPNLATIQVLQYPDGKFAASFDANTSSTGITADFLTSKLAKTREEAIDGAKVALTTWAQNELTKASAADQVQLQKILSEVQQVNAKQSPIVSTAMEKIRAVASDNGFLAVTERAKPIIDRVNNQNAPTGVIPGRKELQVHLATLEEDIQHVLSGKAMEVTIGGKTITIQRKKGQSENDILDQYIKALMEFESQHLKQATVEEATTIEKGEGAKVAKQMDERVQGKPEATLPRELAGAKPRYGFGSKLFTLSFKSDIDKALYIVAQEKRSKADGQYMEFLRGVFPNSTDEQIRTKGATVRAAIKELAREGEPGNLVIERVSKPEAVKEAKKPEPRFAKQKPVAKQGAKVASPIETATKVMPKRANLPILQEFKVEDGNLYTTDLTVALKLKSGLAGGMYKVVGKEVVKSESHADDFPVLPEVTEKPVASVSSQELQSAIKDASNFTAGSSGSRLEIDGVLVRVRDGKITVVSTDSYRLYTKVIEADVQGNVDFIVDGANTIAKVLTAVGENVSIAVSKETANATRYAKFSGDNGEITTKIIDGNFPAWEQIIPSYTTEYTFDRAVMLAAVKELKPYVKNIGNEMVSIEYKDGALKLVADDKKQNLHKEISMPATEKKVATDGGAVNEGVIVMPVRGEGEGRAFIYNRKYIEDALKALTETTTHLYGTGTMRETPGFFSDSAELAPKPKPVSKITRKKAPSGIASAGADKIGNFEELAGVPNKTLEQFKIFEKVKELVKKYAKTIGEGYLPRNALGVYYPDTTNVRITGMNNLSVAAHEITHFLDFAYNISDQLMAVKGYSVKGAPIYEGETAKLRKELTALYEEYYPGARHDHPLKKRMIEGFAAMLEKYTEQPSTITAKYPNVVREFLTSEGSFYKPVIGDIIRDLRDIVAEYQGLPALDKIGARIVNDQVNVNKDSFLNFSQKLKTEIADNIYPIEVLAKKAGVHFTKADPSLWVRQYNNSNVLILGNLNGKRGFWGWRNGELVKLHDFNWKSLIDDIQRDRSADSFGSYLVARREHFLYQEINQLNETIKKLEKDLIAYNAMTQEEKDAAVGEIINPTVALRTANEQRDELKGIVDKDGFTEKEVTDAYTENKERFAELETRYDTLVREDLEFLHDPAVQLLDRDEYNKLTQQEGYASFKRYFYDEVVGEETPMANIRVGKTKVSSLLRRTGSQKPIINPLFSALRNHAEITRKGMKQAIYNRMADIAINRPEIGVFQKLQLKGVPDRQGRILYPQEKDPSIIMARVNYKRVPILTETTIKETLDEVLNFQNINIFEQLILGSSRFFTKGTTGVFPGFALTNIAVDQITGAAQSRNNYIPLYDPLARIAKMLDKEQPDHAYFQEYMVMGGERQTMVGWQDMAPNELFAKITNERKGLLKVVDALNAGMNVLAIPSQWSEIMTRATEYVKAREAGKTQIVALEEAGRVTAPFHHIGRLGGGRMGKVFVKSIPFFNPGIQVLAQAAETLETPEGRQRYAFVALAVTAANIAALGLILAAGSDDQKKLYADIHPDELNKYIWIPSPDGKTLIKLRVPDQMNVLATLVNMMIADKNLNANYKSMEYVNAGMSWLLQQFDVSQPAKMLMSWVPQVIKPGVLTLAGVKDFPKIMPIESQSLQSKPPGLRFTESTSPVAKKVGELLNISPLKLDYLLTGYAGRASGFLTGKPGIYNPFKSMQRQYYFTSGRKLQTYYDLREKNNQDYYAYTHKLRTFKVGEPTKILQQKAKLAQITALVDLYRDIDPDKKPEKARVLRDKILKKLDGL